MDAQNLLEGLRFIDSFFPSGGYAYSSGLEAAVQQGAVRDAKQFEEYVEDVLRGGIGRREAVAVGLAWQAVKAGKLAKALSADGQLDAMKIGQESRMASRQMGRQVMRLATDRIEPDPVLNEFHVALEGDGTPGHLAVCLGLVLGACRWKRRDAVAAFLYMTAVGYISAAMKLLPFGQRQGQQLLAQWAPLFVELSRSAPSTGHMTSWCPVQDIYAMRHNRLASRLFRS